MAPRYSNVTASIRELIIRYASNNFRFIILNPTQRTSKSAPGFLSEKQGRKRASTPGHRLPQYHLGNLQVECITYIKWIKIIPHCHHGYSYARHISCVLRSKHSIRQDKTSKGKDSVHHNKCREGRNIIWSIYVNKAHETSRSWHLKITRERLNT